MAKSIVITGGSRGIGAAVARLAGSRGWSVTLSYVANTNAADEVSAAVKKAGGRAVAVRADVGREGNVKRLFDAAAKAFGPIDGVVNNAGILAPAMPLAEMSIERMKSVIHLNVVGALMVAREAARRMGKSRGGRGGVLINLSSAAAKLGAPDSFIDYAASKGAIESMTIGLSKELGPDGVRVNAVRPGIIETEIHASGGEPGRAVRLGPTTPIGRSGSATEVAEAIVWLLSDESSYVSGAILDVTGGR